MTDAELAAAYRATRWLVRSARCPGTLRIGSPFPAPPDLLPAGIVTAYNPASRPTDGTGNRAASARLRRTLEARGAALADTLAEGTGCDPALWTEPGFLASGLGRDALVEIAGRFGQNAIVWIDERGVPTLVSTRAGFLGTLPGDILPDP